MTAVEHQKYSPKMKILVPSTSYAFYTGSKLVIYNVTQGKYGITGHHGNHDSAERNMYSWYRIFSTTKINIIYEFI